MIAGQSVDYMPDEYIDYLLAKTFHWTPEQINQVDEKTVQVFLKIMELEWEEERRHIKQINNKHDQY